MEQIYWKRTLITTLTIEEQRNLKLLLPYWGLDLASNELLAAFEQRVVTINGMPDDSFELLSQNLAHTGVLLLKEDKGGSDLIITVNYKNSGPHPITLRLNNMTYYLNPLSMRTTDVQEHLFKRIWLPSVNTSLLFRFQPHEARNAAEWLSYVVIQMFHRAKLHPVTNMNFQQYQTLVQKVLFPINKSFARNQLQRGGVEVEAEAEWPDLPPELATTKKMNHDLIGEKKKKTGLLNETKDNSSLSFDKKIEKSHTITPFKYAKTNQNAQTFNPFKFQNRANRRSIINPFQNKR